LSHQHHISLHHRSHTYLINLHPTLPHLNSTHLTLDITHNNNQQHSPTNTMAQEIDWSPSYCLACDRQTDTSAYCSESCRLAEYESSASPSSSPSWPSHSHTPFQLPSAYDFSQKSAAVRPAAHARAHSQPQPRQVQQPTYTVPRLQTRPVLTPSSSQSSLFSMQSGASVGEVVSEEARRELRGYASAFDQSRYQRRQSAS
jgi:hypothetical protein